MQCYMDDPLMMVQGAPHEKQAVLAMILYTVHGTRLWAPAVIWKCRKGHKADLYWSEHRGRRAEQGDHTQPT